MAYDYHFSLISILLLLGMVQGMAVSVLLLARSRGDRANLILALLLFCSVYSYFSDLVIPTGLYRLVGALLNTDFVVKFLIPPLLYAYARALCDSEARLSIRSLLHLIPFALALGIEAPLILQSPATKIALIEAGAHEPPLVFGVDATALAQVQALVYASLCVATARKASARMREKGEEEGESRLMWLRLILGLYILTFLCMAATFAFLMVVQGRELGLQDLFSGTRLLLDLPMMLFFILGYVILLRHPSSPGPRREGAKKYEKSGLGQTEYRRIATEAEAVMAASKPWLDPNFDRQKLARLVGSSEHHLSQAINLETGENFFDYVNGFRVEEAKRLLAATGESVIDIAFASGFNSKATFNKAFKNLTGLTPTEYRRQK